MARCPWRMMNEREIKYHDEEWGLPVRDDRKQFEYLMINGHIKECARYQRLIDQHDTEVVNQ